MKVHRNKRKIQPAPDDLKLEEWPEIDESRVNRENPFAETTDPSFQLLQCFNAKDYIFADGAITKYFFVYISHELLYHELGA